MPECNVLDVPEEVFKKMAPKEFDQLNLKWLEEAYERGDSFWIVTDPDGHALSLESIYPGLSERSRFLNLELPWLENRGLISPALPNLPEKLPMPDGLSL